MIAISYDIAFALLLSRNYNFIVDWRNSGLVLAKQTKKFEIAD